jgi:hypothetical protein
MADIWITVRIKLKWLYAAVSATKEQCTRDHYAATQDKDPKHKALFRAMGDAQWDASRGLAEAQKKVEDDCDSG